MKQLKLMLGDNIESLKLLPDNSIDSVVTDPPYGLKFMGKKWDYQVPTKEFWQEVYRVLKPGGHVLSFGGTRTYHRMVVNLEDGGFEIRDCISWIYGSGFPKSLNIGKAVDKIQGNEREVVGERIADDITGGNLLTAKPDKMIDITKGTTPYEGQGTALKPAQELICMARKPISEKTIAENVMKWGTGGLNIDNSRISIGDEKVSRLNIKYEHKTNNMFGGGNDNRFGKETMSNDGVEGRFPANIIFDEEAGKMLDEQSGLSKSSIFPGKGGRGYGTEKNSYKNHKPGGSLIFKDSGYIDSGGSSRFFYSAKVSKKERNMGLDGFEETTSQLNSGGIGRKISVDKRLENNGENAPSTKNGHPTVKPITLMSYLINLVTPVNGIVLDPFMGSGSTGISAQLNGFRFCGMEMTEEYFKIAGARINNFEMYREFLDKKKK